MVNFHIQDYKTRMASDPSTLEARNLLLNGATLHLHGGGTVVYNRKKEYPWIYTFPSGISEALNGLWGSIADKEYDVEHAKIKGIEW